MAELPENLSELSVSQLKDLLGKDILLARLKSYIEKSEAISEKFRLGENFQYEF